MVDTGEELYSQVNTHSIKNLSPNFVPIVWDASLIEISTSWKYYGMELAPQRTTPNVTVDFAMETSTEPMEQSQWQAGSSTDLSVPSCPRSRSNSCGMVEQLPLEELSYSQCHVLSVDTNLQRVCQALEDGLRLNVPQTSQHHGQSAADDDEDDDCFVIGRPHSAMSSRMLQERRASARAGTGSTTSSHHNRSQSVRAPKRPTYLSPPHSLRPRGTSFPGGGSEEDCYLLRHFIVNGKNVVNRGDSFRNRKTTRSSATSTSSARFVLFFSSFGPPPSHCTLPPVGLRDWFQVRLSF